MTRTDTQEAVPARFELKAQLGFHRAAADQDQHVSSGSVTRALSSENRFRRGGMNIYRASLSATQDAIATKYAAGKIPIERKGGKLKSVHHQRLILRRRNRIKSTLDE